jgi:beta-galactosidase
MGAMGDIFGRITTSELVTERTEESHAAVDIAGLNYAHERYVSDGERFPNRILLGTETNPRDIDTIWRLVEELPHVIGDFTWTGWDYLGEAGLGRTDYAEDPEARGGGDPAYPWLLAWCGDIDITGHRRPASYYRQIVFGLRQEPYIAVFRPEHHGVQRLEMSWAWSDAVSSWSWGTASGFPVEVEVYSAADEVELLLDGTVLGRAPAGPQHRFRAHFDAEYKPGTLTAVAYSAGVEQSRTSLRTASGVRLAVEADRRVLQADDGDLAFISVELRDSEGNLATAADRLVCVEVSGPGVLQALGSARPATEEPFDAEQVTTFDGRALAVIRPTGVGAITVTFTSDGLPTVSLELEVLQ